MAPTATFNAPNTVAAGSPINLSLTNATDASRADRDAGFTYAFDCGDGSGYRSFGASNSASCPTSDSGSRTVKGRVRDKDGNVGEYTRSVTVLPSVRIGDVKVQEKNTNARFTVSLSAASQETVTVNYATVNGTAKAPADYTATTGTLTFSPGQTTKTVAVPIRGDKRDERNETFFADLSGGNTTIADARCKGTIVDND